MRGTSGFAFRLVVLIGLMIALAAGLTVLLNQLKFRQVIERQQARIAQLDAGDLAETFEQSIGLGVQLANVPFRFSDCDVTPRRVAPLLGEHNREIAEELGFAAAEIDAMQREGVLYAEAAARAPAAA